MKRSKHNNLKTLVLANLVMIAGYQIFAPFYAIFATDIGATVSQVGLIWSVYSLSTALLLLIFGKLENYLNKEKIVVYCFFMFSLGAFSFLLANSIPVLIVVLLFNSLIASICIPAYKTVFVKLQDKGRESEEWSWLESGNMIAISIGASMGGFILANFGFNGVFIAMGTVQFIAGCIVYWVYKKQIHLKSDFNSAVAAAEVVINNQSQNNLK